MLNVDLGPAILRLAGAVVLGGVIGAEREVHGRPAGLRTHILVSLGSALFALISLSAFIGADPSRVAAQIVSGVGFLGAGTIMHEGATIRGLTTAASLWVAAAIGLAAAVGEWPLALCTTGLAFLTLWMLPRLERALTRLGPKPKMGGGAGGDLARDLLELLERYGLRVEELAKAGAHEDEPPA